MPPTKLPLRDIQIPEVIGLWPPAIGWWFLAVLIPLSLYLSYKLYRRLTRKTALKALKKHFKILKLNTELSEQQKLIALSSLMRRAAVSLYPRVETASLTGKEWLDFLNQSLKISSSFNTQTGQLLVDAAYRPAPDLSELNALFALCEQWINTQKEPKL